MKAKTLVLSAVTFSLLSLIGCKSDNNETESQTAKYVKVETVQNGSGNIEMVFNGTIKEKSLVNLSFRVGGQIEAINVDAGDYVEKGQIVANIDNRDYNIQLQTNKAQYEQVKAEYERYKTLYEEGKLPANSFEKAESGYKMAKAAYENALNQYNDTELKAPFSGYVYQKTAEDFQTIGAGYPVISLIDKSSFEVVIGVPENQINSVRKSKNNFVTIKNANISDLPVQVLSIGEKTSRDGLFEVRFSFKNNPSINVSPGMSAEITMKCHTENNAMIIPLSAVFNQDNSTYVWVYNPETSTINKKEVKLKSLASEGDIEIITGISIGDSVVTTGVNFLCEGQQVRPIQKPSETNIGGLL